MNQVTYQEPKSLLADDLACQHPIDILYTANPEFASIAWADKAGWLSPEVLRVLPALRTVKHMRT